MQFSSYLPWHIKTAWIEALYNRVRKKCAKTITSILMPLSQLASVSNFCSNSLSPIFSIVSTLPSQVTLFQILFYVFFPQFPWLIFLPLSVISTSITSCIWKLIFPCMTWSYTTADGFELSYFQSAQQYSPYHEEYQSTPYKQASPHTLPWSYDNSAHATSPCLQQ